MPATPNFISGVKGTVTIGGNLFYVKQFKFRMFVALDDITHSGAAGYQVKLPGVLGAEGDLTFTFDTANQPTVSPYNMTPGTLMALNLSPDGTKPYTFSAYSGEFTFASGPKAGDVECTTHAESTGAITVPSS
jgi:hypothetical protein